MAITEKNIFKKNRYRNILLALGASKKGFTVEELTHLLVDEEKLLSKRKKKEDAEKKHRLMMDIINHELKSNIKEKLRKDTTINNRTIKESLDRLIDLTFVKYDENTNRFRLDHDLIRAMATAKVNKNILEFYSTVSNLISLERGVIQAKETIQIYTSSKFLKMYNESRELQVKVERITEKIDTLTKELNELTVGTHDIWKKKGYCDFINRTPPDTTLIIHIPPITEEEYFYGLLTTPPPSALIHETEKPLIVTCQKCDSAMEQGYQFCVKCGTNLEDRNLQHRSQQVQTKPKSNYCISCGKKLIDNFEFCPKCGTKIEQITI